MAGILGIELLYRLALLPFIGTVCASFSFLYFHTAVKPGAFVIIGP
jgi:hypothetical protein